VVGCGDPAVATSLRAGYWLRGDLAEHSGLQITLHVDQGSTAVDMERPDRRPRGMKIIEKDLCGERLEDLCYLHAAN